MPTEAASIVGGRRLRLAGDILWLGITAGVYAAIVGIVCWSLSAELSHGAGSGRPTAAVTPETSAGSGAVALSSTFGINRNPAPGPSSTTAGGVTEGSSSVAPTTSIVALTVPAGVKSLLRDPIADQLQTPALASHDGLAPVPSGPQPAQSALAAHSFAPPRPPQRHQRARPPTPRANGELVPLVATQ